MTHTDKGNYAGKHPASKSVNDSVVQAVKKAARNGKISCSSAHKIAQNCSTTPADAGRAIDLAEVQITHCQLGIFKHSTDGPTGPTDLDLTPELEKELASSLVKGRLSCETAWAVAERFNLSRPQIGAACDRLGIKINACQLGTFG